MYETIMERSNSNQINSNVFNIRGLVLSVIFYYFHGICHTVCLSYIRDQYHQLYSLESRRSSASVCLKHGNYKGGNSKK